MKKTNIDSFDKLNYLIDAALVDNEIDSSELNVLVKKAKKLGFASDMKEMEEWEQDDELKIIIEKKIQERKWVKGKKIAMWVTAGLLLVSLVILFFIYRPTLNKNFNKAIHDNNFDKAYALIPEFDKDDIPVKTKKLIHASIPFYLNSNFPEKASETLKDYIFICDFSSTFNNNSNISAYNKETDKYNSLVFAISNYLLNHDKFNESVNILCLNARPNIKVLSTKENKKDYSQIASKSNHLVSSAIDISISNGNLKSAENIISTINNSSLVPVYNLSAVGRDSYENLTYNKFVQEFNNRVIALAYKYSEAGHRKKAIDFAKIYLKPEVGTYSVVVEENWFSDDEIEWRWRLNKIDFEQISEKIASVYSKNKK